MGGTGLEPVTPSLSRHCRAAPLGEVGRVTEEAALCSRVWRSRTQSRDTFKSSQPAHPLMLLLSLRSDAPPPVPPTPCGVGALLRATSPDSHCPPASRIPPMGLRSMGRAPPPVGPLR